MIVEVSLIFGRLACQNRHPKDPLCIGSGHGEGLNHWLCLTQQMKIVFLPGVNTNVFHFINSFSFPKFFLCI